MLAGGGEGCVGYRAPARRGGPVRLRRLGLDTAPQHYQINEDTRASVATKVASVRAQAWERSAVTKTEPVFLDIDAPLVEIHSENKEQTAPTYKGGFGFHPMFCFADATG